VKTKKGLFFAFFATKKSSISLFTKQTKKQNGISQKKILQNIPFQIEKRP
jgi:hypothetical protein